MSGQRITAKYLADLFDINPALVRRYAQQLRKMLAGQAGGVAMSDDYPHADGIPANEI